MHGSQDHQMGEGKCETRTGRCQLWDHFLTALLLHSVSQEPGPRHNLQTVQLEVTLPFPRISHLYNNLLVSYLFTLLPISPFGFHFYTIHG